MVAFLYWVGCEEVVARYVQQTAEQKIAWSKMDLLLPKVVETGGTGEIDGSLLVRRGKD